MIFKADVMSLIMHVAHGTVVIIKIVSRPCICAIKANVPVCPIVFV
jgi:hypothetical protein